MGTGSWEPNERLSGPPAARRPAPRSEARPGRRRGAPRGDRARRDATQSQARARRAPARAKSVVPLVPTLVGAAIVVVLAFVAGRMTAGDSGSEVSATPTAVVRSTTSTRTQTHTVAPGESLLAISSRYGVTLEELAAANGITNANRVFVGQVLTIPPPTIVSTLPVASTTTSTTRAKK